MITSPMKDSPAEKLAFNLKMLSQKLMVSLQQVNLLDQVVKVVRGKEGTNVRLTIKRGSEEKILILNVVKFMSKCGV